MKSDHDHEDEPDIGGWIKKTLFLLMLVTLLTLIFNRIRIDRLLAMPMSAVFGLCIASIALGAIVGAVLAGKEPKPFVTAVPQGKLGSILFMFFPGLCAMGAHILAPASAKIPVALFGALLGFIFLLFVRAVQKHFSQSPD